VALQFRSPDVAADVGFLQVLGLSLCELDGGRARLIPLAGPELWLESGEAGRLTAVFDGIGPTQDFEGNRLLYQHPPSPATTTGQVTILGAIYPVVDLPNSVSWYEKQLGFEEVFRDEVTQWSELRDQKGRRLVLAFSPELDTPTMLALQVPDAPAEVERLREFDLEPVWTRGVPWGRLAAYLTPSGLPVMLVEKFNSNSG